MVAMHLSCRTKFEEIVPQTKIKPKVGECSELAVLDLRVNALSDLPPELARCTELVFLHVGGNKIAEFGPSLCEAFVNLQELYLYRNKLTSLPPEVHV